MFSYTKSAWYVYVLLLYIYLVLHHPLCHHVWSTSVFRNRLSKSNVFQRRSGKWHTSYWANEQASLAELMLHPAIQYGDLPEEYPKARRNFFVVVSARYAGNQNKAWVPQIIDCLGNQLWSAVDKLHVLSPSVPCVSIFVEI